MSPRNRLCTFERILNNLTLVMNKTNLYDLYKGKADTLAADIRTLKRRGRLLVAAELASFVVAIAFVVGYTAIDGATTLFLWLAALMFAMYVLVRRMDTNNDRRIDRLVALHGVYDGELHYLDGDFSRFDDGERYANPQHEYTFDMDVFGRQSLYNRICRAVTTGGADRLAETLATSAIQSESNRKTSASIRAQAEAAKEVAEAEEWRADFLALGHGHRTNTADVMRALANAKSVKVASVAMSPALLAVAWAAIVGFLSVCALAAFGLVSVNTAVWWGIAQFATVFLLCSKPLQGVSRIVGQLNPQFKAYSGMVSLIVSSGFKTADNRRIVDALTADGAGALESFAELEKIVDGLDRRGNVLGMMLFNVLMLSDYFLLRRFLRWQRRYMGCMDRWIDAVSEMDARVSMATYRYNEPEAIDADVVDADSVVYDVEAIAHPFLGSKAVPNDFAFTDGSFYIVTGANMAGKSTFLRAIGTNYILAMAGMPVFARRMRVSVFSLFSSMRTSDDLAHGISYFNAELLRLKQLIDSCRQSRRTLIILDEILKGTNSLDKLNGSRMFLNAISRLPVTGLIATHDLELSKMSDAQPDRFINYCFEIKLSDQITYTYRIAPGVARNQNASFLLRDIIKDV